MKSGFVYIMASARNGTVYVGSTSDMIQRGWQHREGLADGFTRKHGCKMLVWFEAHEDLQDEHVHAGSSSVARAGATFDDRGTGRSRSDTSTRAMLKREDRGMAIAARTGVIRPSRDRVTAITL